MWYQRKRDPTFPLSDDERTALRRLRLAGLAYGSVELHFVAKHKGAQRLTASEIRYLHELMERYKDEGKTKHGAV